MATILVSGASSGIGRATCERFRDAGHDVWGLARRVELIPAGVHAVQADLADPASLAGALGDVPVDAVDVFVHAAAAASYAPVELTDTGRARREFEVGVFAAAELIQRVLPGMRERGRGRIVLVSSIAASFSSPMAAWYHAEKAALEAMADGLRVEVAPFGVEVALVRPGVVRTDFHDSALAGLGAAVAGTPYEAAGLATEAYHRRSASSAQAVEVAPVVDAIEQAVTAARPKTRYVIGPGGRVASLLPTLVSDRMFDAMIRRQFGLGAPAGRAHLSRR